MNLQLALKPLSWSSSSSSFVFPIFFLVLREERWMEPPEFLSPENGGGKKFLLDNAHGEYRWITWD
jgi:hypothetical protein